MRTVLVRFVHDGVADLQAEPKRKNVENREYRPNGAAAFSKIRIINKNACLVTRDSERGNAIL
jgi:hypothetical protein